MNLRNHSILCPAVMAALAALLLAPAASALTDHLTVVTTNPHTGTPATLELDRYSLRAPNWEARIYSSPTTYTVLPANQVPEVTTYRGRVAEDGGMVYGGVRPNGTLFAKVNYGCRDSNYSAFCDPYEQSSNRYSWVIWSLQLTGQTVNTGYVYAPAANEPVTAPAPLADWFNNLGGTQNFGGPPPYNNMVTMPLNRVRLICSANAYSLGTYGNSIAYTLLGMESAVNETDYVAARDGGVSYQIQASGIQTYAAGDADISADWSNMAGKVDIMCYTANWGVSAGLVIAYPEDMGGGTLLHELGHSLGGPDFCGEDDYQGSMLNTEHGNGGDEMNGVDLYRCLAGRAGGAFYEKSAGYVYYRTPVPTRANPDFVSTSVNTPVSVDVLLNDWNANTTSRAGLSIVSFQNPSERGGTVTDLGGGVLRYTPPTGFRGDDLFRYYVSDPSGRFKSLSGVRVLVVDPSNPLIARYPFDETTGVSALDTSGGGRKGTLTGNGSFATDRVPGVGGVGGALHLSGFVSTWDGSPRLTFGNPNPWTTLNPPDRIASYSYDALDRSQSVSFWYKPDVLPVTGAFDSTHEFHMLYGKHNIYQSGFDDGGGIVLGINNSTLFALVQMYGPHGNPVAVNSGITPQPGMWYHLVGEIDRENQQVHLYVNGVKYSSAAGVLPAGQFVIGSICANLGGQNQGSHTMYAAPAGAYDDLRIYTKALTSTEVTDLYEAPGMLPANLLAPAAGQTGVTPLPLLTWGTGRARYEHDVYFGTDAAAVAAATVSTPGIYLGRTSSTSRQITSMLDPARTYFWRIDEVDGSTIGKGAVWQFTTAVRSPACDLLSFNWGGYVGSIIGTKVTLVVPYGTNLTALNPTCTVSSMATVSPASGGANNFGSPVSYTVTAQDGATKVYAVTVYQGPAPGTIATVPPGLNPGDSYRLVFVTSTETHSGGADQAGLMPPGFTTVAQFNDFATSAATAVPALASLGTTWKAVISATASASVDARTNTATDSAANAGTSAPIYQLGGRRVADGYADLWDGTIQNPINVNELGGGPVAQGGGLFRVWTGASSSGGNGGGDQALINQGGGWINNGLANATDSGWVSGNYDNDIHGDLQPIYAMSGILSVPASPTSCDMLAFQWGTSSGVITGTNISLTVPYGTNVTTLNPTCTVSFGATVSPVSGSTRNFSAPVSYTVTSQNGSAAKTYTVTVTLAAPVPHTLTVNNGSGGGSYVNGTVVALAAGTPPSGQVFDKWVINAGSPAIANPNAASTTLTMGTGDAMVTATYKAGPDPIMTVPPGLNPGDHYRLVFVTSTETYSGGSNHGPNPPWFTTVADYNAFATTTANAVPALAALSTPWKAIITTQSPDSNAKDNTGTNPSSSTGVPIYNLGGRRVADNNADLWDGTIQNPINVNELGRGPVAQSGDVYRVWTGGVSPNGFNLITQSGGWIINGSADSTTGWIANGNYDNAIHGDLQPIYAISGILTVPPPSNNYAAWAAANNASTDPAADSNHNGVPNGIEHFMGGTALAPATLPPLVNTAATWTWTIPYDPTAAANYYFEVSTNLQSWIPLSPGNPAIAVLAGPARLRLTLPSGMRFCRLVVTR
ncbi:MAG: Ig-like domain-containing protein [Verrucomicrobia bacterium]|nr:Ig-like domain-containing protein [Verrucomicrobiota bacterium]